MVSDSKPQASCDLVHHGGTKAAHGHGDQKLERKPIFTEQQEPTERAPAQRTPERGSHQLRCGKSSSSASSRGTLMKILTEQNEMVKRLLAEKEKMMADHLKLQVDLQRKMEELKKRSHRSDEKRMSASKPCRSR
uniref:Uncharacterized protein n=1 Tax=Anopheles maculatus TaxID=74869 RepID=A0A182SY33_9DIPT